MFGDQRAHQRWGFDPDAEGLAGMIHPDQRFEAVLIDALAHPDLSAVAPGGTPARAVGVEDHHRPPLPRAVQGRAQAGETATNDADIGFFDAAQPRALDHVLRRRSVVGRGEGPRPVVEVKKAVLAHVAGCRFTPARATR
ncbi:MAG: Uncharacterised protein [Rhodospirillaceae bacterium]|nr:MAG: Uncharacterised protein [Rhodospirillaceae bacterium]